MCTTPYHVNLLHEREWALLPPRPLLIVPCPRLSSQREFILRPAHNADSDDDDNGHGSGGEGLKSQQAFILRAGPFNCPHCSDLNVCNQNPSLSVSSFILCRPAGWSQAFDKNSNRLRPLSLHLGISLRSGVWLLAHLAHGPSLVKYLAN